jgi:hypothetical protein
MDWAIDCTLDELTGSGSVSTAASIAVCKIAKTSGVKDALAKSFIGFIQKLEDPAKLEQRLFRARSASLGPIR